MRILFTNNTLLTRAGTELFVRDLAVALIRRGHEVAAYSLVLGGVADEMRAANVHVVDRLSELTWRPEIIHGHHHLEFMTALLYYRRTPAVFVSHGWIPWVETPPRHPRIMEYFAVDIPTRDAAVKKLNISEDLIRLLPNFVDLNRFKSRSPLPARPRRAVVLSNYAREDTHLPFIREACAKEGMEVDVFGSGVDHVVMQPEEMLSHYDVVFAKGRSALEAVAVGNAVIICDKFGVGPMVTLKNAQTLQRLEGDYHSLYEPLSAGAITRELAKYQPSEAAAVCQLARASVGLDSTVSTFIDSYQRAITRFGSAQINEDEEAAAEAAYLASIVDYIKENPAALHERDTLAADLEAARGEAVRLAKALMQARKPMTRRMAEGVLLRVKRLLRF